MRLMIEALLALLPVAVGIVLSPLAVVTVILMLISPHARANGLAFLVGWAAGLTAVGGLTLLLAEDQGVVAEDEKALWAILVRIALGAGLLYLAWRSFKKRPVKGAAPELPGWMTAVSSFTPLRSFSVAAAFVAVKPKNLLLTVSAMLDVALAGLPALQTTALLAVFVVLSSLGIAGPVVYALAGGERAQATLNGWRTWLATHNAVIVAVVLAVLGAKVLVEGLLGLAG
jgi:hypothetical protein